MRTDESSRICFLLVVAVSLLGGAAAKTSDLITAVACTLHSTPHQDGLLPSLLNYGCFCGIGHKKEGPAGLGEAVDLIDACCREHLHCTQIVENSLQKFNIPDDMYASVEHVRDVKKIVNSGESCHTLDYNLECDHGEEGNAAYPLTCLSESSSSDYGSSAYACCHCDSLLATCIAENADTFDMKHYNLSAYGDAECGESREDEDGVCNGDVECEGVCSTCLEFFPFESCYNMGSCEAECASCLSIEITPLVHQRLDDAIFAEEQDGSGSLNASEEDEVWTEEKLEEELSHFTSWDVGEETIVFPNPDVATDNNDTTTPEEDQVVEVSHSIEGEESVSEAGLDTEHSNDPSTAADNSTEEVIAEADAPAAVEEVEEEEEVKPISNEPTAGLLAPFDQGEESLPEEAEEETSQPTKSPDEPMPSEEIRMEQKPEEVTTVAPQVEPQNSRSEDVSDGKDGESTDAAPVAPGAPQGGEVQPSLDEGQSSGAISKGDIDSESAVEEDGKSSPSNGGGLSTFTVVLIIGICVVAVVYGGTKAMAIYRRRRARRMQVLYNESTFGYGE